MWLPALFGVTAPGYSIARHDSHKSDAIWDDGMRGSLDAWRVKGDSGAAAAMCVSFARSVAEESF